MNDICEKNLLKHKIDKRILLLQGPVGNFFSQLHDYLIKNQAEIIVKVNFNAGDDFYYRHDNIVRFKRPLHELFDFYQKLMKKHHFESVYLFGDCREIHKIAIDFFGLHGVKIYVFEEGYLRPNFITLEQNGVNARSNLPRNISIMRNAVPKQSATCYPHKQHGYSAFKNMMIYAIIYFFLLYIFQSKYPFYVHHKPVGIADLWGWLLSYIRKPFYKICDKITQNHIFKKYKKQYFFVPLQLYNDSQVTHHSPYYDIKDFIEHILLSFARHAPDDMRLVIKHHPMDRGHRNYKKFIQNRCKKLGIKHRVFYVHEINLPKFLRFAKGTVVINSTVGLSSIFHNTPVKVMGNALYDMGGLTYQDSLECFWKSNVKVNMENYDIFRKYVIEKMQIKGSFYSKKFLY